MKNKMENVKKIQIYGRPISEKVKSPVWFANCAKIMKCTIDIDNIKTSKKVPKHPIVLHTVISLSTVPTIEEFDCLLFNFFLLFFFFVISMFVSLWMGFSFVGLSLITKFIVLISIILFLNFLKKVF